MAMTRRDGHTPKSGAQSCVITEMISGVASPRWGARIFFGTCGDGEMSLTQVIPQPATIGSDEQIFGAK